MTKAFIIAGIIGMIFFILLMFGMANQSLTEDISYSGGTQADATEELGTFGTLLNFVFPESFANGVENVFGYIVGALTFSFSGSGTIGVVIGFILWLFIFALIWIVVELVRGV